MKRLVVSVLGYIALATTVGCTQTSQSTDKIVPRDVNVLATHVQPYLDLACASMDCHGTDGRPLRLYSELGRRAQSSLRPQAISNAHDPLPLDAEELQANCDAFAALDAAGSKAAQPLALLKPLAASAGGLHHVGGVHWASKSDPGYLCLRGFLLGDISQDVGSMCAMATAALQP
jgi:hypothetical protein